MKIVLAGSPQISVEAFRKVMENFEVIAVVTQPDRPRGRGMQVSETPVAMLAREFNIKAFKPEKIGDIYEELKELNYDLFLTFAYGQYIPKRILELGTMKPMNIHGSLLPKYRGAAPIHYAILNGDEEIGITYIEMGEEMDAGAMYMKASRKIDENTTTGQGFEIVSQLASETVIDFLNKLKDGKLEPEEQHNDFTLSPKISKAECLIEKSFLIEEAIRRVNAFNPFPGAYMFIDEQRVKIFKLVRQPKKGALNIEFKDGKLYATRFQYEGKKKVILQ